MSQATYIQAGLAVDYTPSGAAVAAGQVVVQNNMVGIAKTPIADGALGALATSGVFDVVKKTGAINAGASVYWHPTEDPVDGTAGSGAAQAASSGATWMGYAVAAAASGDQTVRVLVLPATAVTSNHYGPLNNAIADPGDAEAIPVTASGYVALVTAGAETRTLAAPAFIGQELLVYMKTDGGDCVVTCTTTVNETGNNTITFANEGEACRLVAVEDGANRRWRLAAVDGAALSTV